jgi:cell division cycle 20-like protein 1 (cofactor of APC complex)
MKSNVANIENEKQRTGLDSILRYEDDIQMTTDSSQLGLKSVRKIPKVPFKVLDAPLL